MVLFELRSGFKVEVRVGFRLGSGLGLGVSWDGWVIQYAH